MSRKPENQFIAGVHKYLPHTHKEKMYNPLRSGTADVWYSGSKGDLWVEYKYIPKIPKSLEIVPALTDRQRKWLNDRYAEGRNIAVVLGHPDGGVVYHRGDWHLAANHEVIKEYSQTRKEIAEWIQSQTGESPSLCNSQEQSSKPQSVVKRSTKS